MPNLVINSRYVHVRDTRTLTKRELRIWRKRWPNWMPWELDSYNADNAERPLTLTVRSLDGLQRLRELFGSAIVASCAYRTTVHNIAAGSRIGESSQHRKGTAYDLIVTSIGMARRIEALAIQLGFTAIGRYPGRKFIHIDMRPARATGGLFRWGPGSWEGMT